MRYSPRSAALIPLLLLCLTAFSPTTYADITSNTTFVASRLLAASPSFNLTVNPLSHTVQAGGKVDYSIGLISVNSFQGQVTLQTRNFPAELTGAFNPTSVSLTAGGIVNSTLTVYAIAGAFQDYYEFTIQATSGSITQNVNASITISQENPPPSPASYAFLASVLIFAILVVWYGLRSRGRNRNQEVEDNRPKPPPV